MKLNVAVQMDPIAGIDITGDSTFAILLEAQKRGHSSFYYLPQDLALDAGRLMARGHELRVEDVAGAHYEQGAIYRADLASFDTVLLRQDPPFDMGYITTTHLLERIHPRTLVVNDPFYVRNSPEKVFVLDFQDLMPPTLVTRSLEDVRAFRAQYGDIIIKPLYGNGGAGVFLLKRDDTNLNAMVETFQSLMREPFMVQEYRPEVRGGDKRIILIDGEVAGAINRIPAEDDARSNMHAGGRAEALVMSDRDHEICERLAPHLRERGLLFTGIDVIGPYLTEINVTSPTGIRQVAKFGGANIAGMIWDAIERKCAEARR